VLACWCDGEENDEGGTFHRSSFTFLPKCEVIPLYAMTAKWTDFEQDGDNLVVCIVHAGGGAAAVVDKFNRLYGPPPLAQLQARNTLVLPWKERDLAYPLMDLALREGLTIFSQTHTPLLLRPSDLYTIDVLTPRNMELLHVQKVEAYLKESVPAFLPWICDLHPTLYYDEEAWVTKEGRALVATISALLPRDIIRLEVVESSSSDEDTDPYIIDITDEKGEPNEVLDPDARVCAICIVAQVKSIILPCMCVAFCATCARDAKRPQTCPYCRKVIECVLIDES
jgi:hypothetical protein